MKREILTAEEAVRAFIYSQNTGVYVQRVINVNLFSKITYYHQTQCLTHNIAQISKWSFGNVFVMSSPKK